MADIDEEITPITEEEFNELLRKQRAREREGISVKDPILEPVDTSPEAMGDFLGKAAEAVDVPGSIARAGVFGAAQEGSTALGEMGEQIERLQKGTEGAKLGPRGEDIMEAMGVESETGQAVGGFVTEMATDPLSYGPAALGKFTKFLKPVEKKIRSKAQKSVARVLGEYVTSAQFAGEGVDPKLLSMRLIEDDLVKHINKPEKLLEVIQGTSQVQKSNILKSGETALKKVGTKPGLISSISDDLAGHIDEVSSFTPDIKNFRISNPIEAKQISDMLSRTSGVPYDKAREMRTNKFIKSIMGKKQESMSLKDLYSLKKNLGKQMSSKEFWKSPESGIAEKKEVMVEMIRQIDDIIRDQLSGVKISIDGIPEDAAKYYDVQNNRMHHLIQLRGIMNSVPLKELKRLNIPQILIESGFAGAAMGTAGAMGGLSPMQAALSGAGASAAWGARTAGNQAADTAVAKGIDRLSKSLPLLGPMGTQATRELRDEPVEVETPYAQRLMDRKPQGAFNPMPPQERLDNMNLPKQLIEARLPRTTEGVLENKQILKMKVAQQAEQALTQRRLEAGMPPEMIDPAQIREEAANLYKDVSQLVDTRPEEVGDMLPMWIKMFPGMFEKDRYGRIDGVVPMSAQPAVREEIRKNPGISNVERINQLDLLNRTGEYKEQ